MPNFCKPLAGLCLFLSCIGMCAQETVQPAETGPKLAIVSPTHSPDSRGEVVYEVQGKSQMDVPVTPGIFIGPKPTSIPGARYSKALQKIRFVGEVTIEGVVTTKGDVIDLVSVGSPNKDAEASAMAAVAKYRFRPATLGGMPVASWFHAVVNFWVR